MNFYNGGFYRNGFYGPAVSSRRFVSFNPASLSPAAWYDPSDMSSMWQDSAGTTPAAIDSPVGKINDKSGNANHLTQATADSRPVLRRTGGVYYLEFDGTSDSLFASFTLNQPVDRLSAFRMTDTAGDVLESGISGGALNGMLQSLGGTLRIYAGVALGGLAFTSDADMVVVQRFDNTASSLKIDNGTPVEGSAGSNALGGHAAAALDGTANHANLRWHGTIIVGRNLTAAETLIASRWLAAKQGRVF